MRPVEHLRHRPEHFGAGRVRESRELLEMLVDVVPVARPLERRADE
jgi:hypothetical protein